MRASDKALWASFWILWTIGVVLLCVYVAKSIGLNPSEWQIITAIVATLFGSIVALALKLGRIQGKVEVK